MKWYLKALKQYADFSGRARRSEFWFFILFNIIFTIVAMMVDSAFGMGVANGVYGPVYVVYTLAMIIPGLAVSVRRLHDVGKSGFWILISLIPLIGAIWLIILYATDSQPGPNKWGPNPKEVPMDYPGRSVY